MNQVQEALKQAGYNRNQVSVRRSNGSYRIAIKDLSIHADKIKAIAQPFESYRVCEYSGDILQGGNTFVFINYDTKAEFELQQSEFFQQIRALVQSASDKVEDNRLERVGNTNLLIGKNGSWLAGWLDGEHGIAINHQHVDSMTMFCAVGLLNGSIQQRN